MESLKDQENDQNNKKSAFYYKIVAKTLGKYLSIFDGKTQYNLGQTLHQKPSPDFKGGFYVYKTLEEAIFGEVPYNKSGGGLYFAPRTVLKCMCWGEIIQYDKGKIAVEYICPVQDMGMPKGYLTTKTAQKEAYEIYQKQKNEQKLKKKEKWNNLF